MRSLRTHKMQAARYVQVMPLRSWFKIWQHIQYLATIAIDLSLLSPYTEYHI